MSVREAKKRKTREDLYDAALELFSERAYADTTVEDVCARAEVSRATFFRFYGNKAGLLTEFNRRLAASIADEIATSDRATAVDTLWMVQAAIARTWSGSGVAMREMAREWIRTAASAEFADSPHPEMLDLVADIIERGQAAGELRGDKDPRFVAWLVLGSLSAVVAGWLGDGDEHALERATRDVLELLLRGVTS